MSFLIVVIALTLIFDYINVFHDAANSIATVVSTKVLTPFQAVLWAAFFNFIALYIFTDFNVATTISKTVKEEVRANLINSLKEKKNVFNGILGYEDTVIPDVERAILYELPVVA